MKGIISAVVLVAASLVSGQNFGAEPSCAIPCLTSAISVAGCALTDQACQCGTGKAAIQTAVTPCLLSACSPGDLGIAASVGQGLCSAYSLTATGLSVTTTATTSLASPSSGPSSTIIISTPNATTNGTRTSTVTAVTTSVASTTSKASTSSTKSNSISSSTSSATSSAASVVSSAGAGHMMAAGVGGVVGILGAVVAAL